MIKIQVKGHTLSLRRGTALTVELNNALFAAPDIEGNVKTKQQYNGRN